jgi:hypothetical protein
LAGHPLVTSWSPQQIASSPWNEPGNDPGNCPANPSAVSLNSSGFAELDTTGQANNCTSVQSPQTVPTGPGYVYEGDIYFSNFQDWPAFWMYGNDWPSQGEIDAVEANFGTNHVTWHFGANNSTIGTGSGNGQLVQPASANISPGWHVVDIAFTSSSISLYYDGQLYVSIPESITVSGSDPMWLTVSDGSCESGGNNVCATGALGTPGNVQVKYIREFS